MAMSKYQELLAARTALINEGTAATEADVWTGSPEQMEAADAREQKLAALNRQIGVMERQREAERSVSADASYRAGATDRLGGPSMGGAHPRAGDAPWKGLGEQLQAIALAGTPGGQHDPRLYQAAASGGNTTVPADGGFLVQTDYSTALLDRAIEAAVLAPLCSSIEIGPDADSIEMPYIDETSRATGSRWGGVQVYRRAEADTVTAQRPKIANFELRLADILGLAYVTDRVIKDASALQQIFTKAFTSEFSFKIDDELVRGPGGAACMGILNLPSVVSVSKETGQAAATIVQANLSNMWIRLPVRSRPRSVWLTNGEVDPQLDVLTIPAGVAALEPRFVNYGPDGLLRVKGRPVMPIEQAAALGTVGDIMLVDMSEYILIRKGGLEFAESMHVRFIYGENTYRWTQRINGGTPWRTALTPYKGSATLSPFVTLATRA